MYNPKSCSLSCIRLAITSPMRSFLTHPGGALLVVHQWGRWRTHSPSAPEPEGPPSGVSDFKRSCQGLQASGASEDPDQLAWKSLCVQTT